MDHINRVYCSVPLRKHRDIRLIELYPAVDEEAPIRCTLHSVPLDCNLPRYKALSYVWGTDQASSKAIVNGAPVTLQANLDQALRRLRMNDLHCCNLMCSCQDSLYPGEAGDNFTAPTTFLWIDAVCINQNDIAEKNSQVRLMREIFGSASEVILWIGEDSDDTITAFRFLNALAELYDATEDDGDALLSHIVKDEYYKPAWIALGDLLNRAWWKRIWILQEVLLANKALLVCGQWRAEWSEIIKATAVSRRCLDRIDELLEATVTDTWTDYFFPVIEGYGRLRLLRILNFFLKRANTTGESEERDSLRAMLLCTKKYYASEPRDKIYGLLGLVEALGSHVDLPVRYEDPVCYLFMRVAISLYENSKSLEFLNLLERRGQDHVRNFDLPSWVPDFSSTTRTESIWGNGEDCPTWLHDKNMRGRISFSFTKGSKCACSFDLSKKRAIVTGFMVDTVEVIAQRFFDLDAKLGTAMAARATRFGKRIEWEQPARELEFECHTFWQTRLGLWVAQLSQALQIEADPADPARCQHEVAEPKPLSSSVFRTTHDRLIGICHSEIRPGDAICGLFGTNLPYALRKQQGNDWMIVGAW